MEALKFIQEKLDTAGISYEFGQWTSAPVYPYFVGEYQETEPMTEDGLHEFTFMINGFSKGTWLELEQKRAAIEKLFSDASPVITGSGSGLVVSYAGSLTVPTGDAEFKRIQINLSIKEWRIENDV